MSDIADATPRHVLMDRLHRSIDALAYAYSHTEVIDAVRTDGSAYRYRHISRHPSLLEQLAESVSGNSTGNSDDGPRGIFASGAPVSLEAIDRHRAIAAECRDWLARTGTAPRGNLGADVRALPGAAARLDTDAVAELAGRARAWVCWARTMAGWDSAPWSPDSPCPVCSVHGALRVRLSARTGMCVDCGAYWDRSSIEKLAEFVRLWSESHRSIGCGTGHPVVNLAESTVH